MCVCPPALRKISSLLRFLLPRRCLANTLRRRRLVDGQLSSLYPTSPSSSSFAAACVTCCFPPASSSTPLRPSVHYPSISLIVNIMCIRIFCDHLNVFYMFDQTCIVLKSGWNSTARMPPLVRRVNPLFFHPASLPPSFPPSSSPSLPPSSPASLPPLCIASTLLLFHPIVYPPSPVSIPAVRVELQSKQLVCHFHFY